MPYSIEARSLGIAGVASHDFWVLRDERGTALAELHGLATDRQTGQAVPIGTDESRHSLRIWHYAHDAATAAQTGSAVAHTSYIQADQSHRTVLTAPKEEVMARWNAAVHAKAPLNALDLNYPNYGFRMDGSTINSNSAYRTLGEIMGVPVRDFPGVVEPGFENRMTTPERIEQMRDKHYPVLDAPSRREGERYVPLPGAGLATTAPAHDDTLFAQTRGAVGRLDASLGRIPDETTDRVALNLAAAAQQAGLSRVDHVVLSEATDRLRAGENIFAVQGPVHAADNRVAHLRSADAVAPPSPEAIALAQQAPGPSHDAASRAQVPGTPQPAVQTLSRA